MACSKWGTNKQHDIYKEMHKEGLEANNTVADALINGLRKNGRIEETKSLFKEMKEEGVARSCELHLSDGWSLQKGELVRCF